MEPVLWLIRILFTLPVPISCIPFYSGGNPPVCAEGSIPKSLGWLLSLVWHTYPMEPWELESSLTMRQMDGHIRPDKGLLNPWVWQTMGSLKPNTQFHLICCTLVQDFNLFIQNLQQFNSHFSVVCNGSSLLRKWVGCKCLWSVNSWTITNYKLVVSLKLNMALRSIHPNEKSFSNHRSVNHWLLDENCCGLAYEHTGMCSNLSSLIMSNTDTNHSHRLMILKQSWKKKLSQVSLF